MKSLLLASITVLLFITLSAADKTYRFELYSIDGKLTSSEEILQQKKTKILVVDFFSLYCEPCKKALPQWEQQYQKLKKRGLSFVVIVLPVEDNRMKEFEKIKKFFDAKKYSFPVLFDKYSLTGKRYKVVSKSGSAEIPQIFLIDKDGKLIETGSEHKKMSKKVNKLLAH